jgi:thiamine biosynthesis lipoprotein
MDAQQATASFEALGSTAIVAVSEPGALEPAVEVVQHVVAEFDRACSRFRQDSELTAVNLGAGNAVQVSETLLSATDAALRAARLTDGDVDPTVGDALIALGYDRDFAELVPSSRRAPTIQAVPGWTTVQVDVQAGTIRVPQGVKLDLGATAKALTADRAAALATEETGCGVLVSLGGDMAIAGSPPADGWRVRVTDDHRSGVAAPGQWIALRSGGLATSSTVARRWEKGGEEVHHLLDPATGRPARGPWRTVSVNAGSCLDANIASSAAIIRGERAEAWLEAVNLPSRLVGVDGSVRHLAGWPRDGDDLS